jgi:hypothetical protein
MRTLLSSAAALSVALAALVTPNLAQAREPGAAFRPVDVPAVPERFCMGSDKVQFLSRVRMGAEVARANAALAEEGLADIRREQAAYAATVGRAQAPVIKAVNRGRMDEAARIAMLIGAFEAELDALPQTAAELEAALAQNNDHAAKLVALEARARAMPIASCPADGS